MCAGKYTGGLAEFAGASGTAQGPTQPRSALRGVSIPQRRSRGSGFCGIAAVKLAGALGADAVRATRWTRPVFLARKEVFGDVGQGLV